MSSSSLVLLDLAPSFLLPSVPTLNPMWVNQESLCELSKELIVHLANNQQITPHIKLCGALPKLSRDLPGSNVLKLQHHSVDQRCAEARQAGNLPHVSPVSHIAISARLPGQPKPLFELWLHLGGWKEHKVMKKPSGKGTGIYRVCSLCVMTSGSSPAAFNGHLSDTVY